MSDLDDFLLPTTLTMNKEQRKRKICDICGNSFSARHFYRHTNICGKYESETSTNSSLSESEEFSPVNDESFGLNPNHDTFTHEFSQVLQRRSNLNIEEEDRVFFEQISSAEGSETSDSDSEWYEDESGSDIDVETFTLDDKNSNSTGNQFDVIYKWILTFLVMWQSAYNITDMALTPLLKLLDALFTCLSIISAHIKDYIKVFPKDMRIARKILFGSKAHFLQYVICPGCLTLYNFEECVTTTEGVKVSKHCSYVEFPNHKQKHMRKKCGQKLLKCVTLPGGTNKLVPWYTYNYKSLKESFQLCIKRPYFEESCELWQKRSTQNGYASDIYDGKIWREFLDSSGNCFFDTPGNYGVILNVDWFQPFKFVSYSVGVVYLAFLNLPRSERYKRRNIILVGIIPGMKKEPKTNTFLAPLVAELLEAWNEGFVLKSYKSPNKLKTFKLALLCCGCDIPACRKVCGFLGHTANKGCNRCLKEFPGAVGEKSYGGFDRQSWKARDRISHLKHVKIIQSSTTKATKQQLESKYGCRYSVLLDLPYFDPIRMAVVDPMHNLFLGTAKHVIKVWKEEGLLTDEVFQRIQEKADRINCPADVGRIPRKIATGFSGFNADQFKNWTIIFSMYALYEFLPREHLICWQKFVLACRILCCKVISLQDIHLADELLLKFCRNFEQLYGEKRITPNMHLHLHLRECLVDYGPVYGFWLFSFERENGILGQFPTNKKNIEAQLMSKYLYNFQCVDLELPEQFKNILGNAMMPLLNNEKHRGTLSDIHVNNEYGIEEMKMTSRRVSLTDTNWHISKDHMDLIVPSKKPGHISDNDLSYLRLMYARIYPQFDSDSVVFKSCFGATQVLLNGCILGSQKSRTVRSSCVVAYWCDTDGSVARPNEMDLIARPGKIERFFVHNVQIQGELFSHVLAKVKWFHKLPQHITEKIGNIRPVTLWSSKYVHDGPASFIPVQRIKTKFVSAEEIIDGKSIVYVCPRDKTIC